MLISTVVLVGAFYLGSAVLIPMLLAYFVFVLLDPLVDWGERRRVARRVSAPVLILLFMGSSGAVGWGGYGTIALLGQQLPQYQHKISQIVASVVDLPSSEAWRDFLLKGLNSVFAGVAMFLLIPILSLFLLLERDHLGRRLRAALGPELPLAQLARENSNMVRAFFLGNLVVGAVTSAFFLVLFSFLGLDNALALAVFSGFINLIPIVGSVLGALLPAVQAILQFDTPGPVVGILVTAIVLHVVVANLVMPKIVGTRINVNLSAATVGFIFWGWCWGGVGLLMAIPLMALVRGVLALKPATRPWADLIAEGPPEGGVFGVYTDAAPTIPKIGRRKAPESSYADTTARL